MTPRIRADRALSRALRLPPPTNEYRADRGVRVPMRDGVELIADHYIPDTAEPIGTLLVRCPYGRAFPVSTVFGGMFAARGYHVIVQSVRGTFGSGGDFEPTVNEAADGADTVAWMRQQPWYTGTFVMAGISYLGTVQWALLQDPPADMVAAVVIVGNHDFPAASWGSGAFAVNDYLLWSYAVSHQEDPRSLRGIARRLRLRKVLARTAAGVPLADTGRALLRDGAPWWEGWLEHPDVDDPYWDRYKFYGALDRATVPVLLVGGWQDVFLQQTIEQYHRLHARGVDVALTIGPWTHGDMSTRAAPRILRESLDWLGQHLTGRPASRSSPVHIFVTGGGGWRQLAEWPPATAERTWFLEPGRLASEPSQGPPARSTFTFDPRHPTPTVGGQLLSNDGGYLRDERLAERGDVLAFTGEPLAEDLYVYGAPVIELDHDADNPHADLFVRVSEVDRKGRSHNVSDGYRRLTRTGREEPVRLVLDEIAHRFRAGSRIRVLVAGGSHPRFARNLGTGEDQGSGRGMRPATHTIHHGGASVLRLPTGTAIARRGGPTPRGV